MRPPHPTSLVIDAGAAPGDPDAGCPATLTYASPNTPDAVAVAGRFNEWSSTSDRMQAAPDGSFTLTLTLPPGAYPYKFVELQQGAFEEEEAWTCDPNATLISCEDGYKEPWDTNGRIVRARPRKLQQPARG